MPNTSPKTLGLGLLTRTAALHLSHKPKSADDGGQSLGNTSLGEPQGTWHQKVCNESLPFGLVQAHTLSNHLSAPLAGKLSSIDLVSSRLRIG